MNVLNTGSGTICKLKLKFLLCNQHLLQITEPRTFMFFTSIKKMIIKQSFNPLLGSICGEIWTWLKTLSLSLLLSSEQKYAFSLLPLSDTFFQTHKMGILKVLLWLERGLVSQDSYTPRAHHRRRSR